MRRRSTFGGLNGFLLYRLKVCFILQLFSRKHELMLRLDFFIVSCFSGDVEVGLSLSSTYLITFFKRAFFPPSIGYGPQKIFRWGKPLDSHFLPASLSMQSGYGLNPNTYSAFIRKGGIVFLCPSKSSNFDKTS